MRSDVRNDVKIARGTAANTACALSGHADFFSGLDAWRNIDPHGISADHTSRTAARVTIGTGNTAGAQTARASLNQIDRSLPNRLLPAAAAFGAYGRRCGAFRPLAVTAFAWHRPLNRKGRLETFYGVEKIDVNLRFDIFAPP